MIFRQLLQTHTDKKENQIFLIYREIQNGAVAKSYMRKGFLIYEEMREYLTIYEEAVSHIRLCNCSILKFLIYEKNLIFFFTSVVSRQRVLEARIPGNLEPDKVPQMITITFNGAVNSDNLDLYQEIFADRLNPNGCQIKGKSSYCIFS